MLTSDTCGAPWPNMPKTTTKCRCGDCQTVFAVVETPIALDLWITAMKAARCPACGSAKLFIADETTITVETEGPN